MSDSAPPDGRGISRPLGLSISLLGNLAVLIGLGFVVVELRQNRQSLDAEIRLSLSAANQEMASRSIGNPEFAETMFRFFTDSALSPRETVQIQGWVWEISSVVYAVWDLRNDGIISDEMWTAYSRNITLFLRNESFARMFYGQFSDTYPEEYLAELRRLTAALEAAEAAGERSPPPADSSQARDLGGGA